MDRRRWIAAAAAVVTCGLAECAERVEGLLELRSLHTGESVRFSIREGEPLAEEVRLRVERVLRDHRSGESHPMDEGLFVQLARLAALAGVEAKYDIISSYRSPATNAKLRERSNGVSSRSLHMEGRAMDVRLQGVETVELATLARGMRAGGVGCYPADRFVHLDTGRVRTWDG